MLEDRDLVKDKLKERIEELCQKLLPEGRRRGDLWVDWCPENDDREHSTPEFKVVLRGNKGAGKCWRCGWTCDVLGLVQCTKNLNFREAMDWSRDFLGLRYLTPEERRALDREVKQKARQEGQDRERRRLFKISKAEEKFLAGAMLGARSAAELHARRYFAGRACALEDVQNIDEATFRFSDASEYWPRGDYRHEGGKRFKVKAGPAFPAVHSAMRSMTGQVTAVHVTFLDPALAKKIELEDDNSKLIFGEAKGAVIRISHGPEGKPPEVSRVAHPLILCEGIETGLSLAIAVPAARVWAAGSLSNMANAPVGLDCVESVIVARDNNDGNAQAQRQLAAVLEAIAAAEKPWTVMNSHVGDDFNDLLKGEE